MNWWQKFGAVFAVLVPLTSSIWWAANNIVLAEDFKQYQISEKIRWLFYDADKLWREYQEVQKMPDSPLVRQRMAEIKRQMQQNKEEIQAMRRAVK